MAGIPGVDLKAGLPEGALGHGSPVARVTPGFNRHWGESELNAKLLARPCVYSSSNNDLFSLNSTSLGKILCWQ